MKDKVFNYGRILYVLSQCGDVLSTLIALNYCGSYEANIIVNALLNQSLLIALLHKTIIIVAVLFILTKAYQKNTYIGIAGTYTITGFMLGIAFHNLANCIV